MFFWITASLLTIAAIMAVLIPLARGPARNTPASRHDLEVYKDQLAEVERDLGRGALSATDAEEARAEISRRILRLEPTVPASGNPRGNVARLVGMAAVLSVPLVGWGVYGALGSPDMPSQPLQARLQADPGNASVDELVARAERHLAANPDDGRGWDVIAPIYQRLGRAEAAANAYRKTIDLLGSTAGREAGLGEALATIAGGSVAGDARAAFERALVIEPGYPKALFYLATAEAQQGDYGAARTRWEQLLAGLPADSAWKEPTERALVEVTAAMAGAPGPSRADVDAAASMSDADRNMMIDGMVSQLDARLRENPNDGEGWRRLVRSYVVLGRIDDARAAYQRGVAALDGAEADQLANLAASLGVVEAKQQ